jgi:hypothetical protein
MLLKMSIPSDIQAIIDKFSATAESLEDLQGRLREGLDLGEGWCREEIFRLAGEELQGYCATVAVDLGQWTPDVLASVE